jgi:peptidoglycan hydrolase-like protein with peptidoglycan-binding domain
LRKAKAIWMTDGAAVAPAGGPDPVLRKGDQGADVMILQNELIEAGFKVFADGDFGDNTQEAVMAFQTRHGLNADGVVGTQTWGVLRAD